MNYRNKRHNPMENNIEENIEENIEKSIEKNRSINVLMLEDSPHDAEIIQELLIDAGYRMNIDCTAFEKEFVSFLKSKKYDIVLSDFMLPGFDAFGALKCCKEICPDTPFICVSGSIGEDTAVALLRQGADDYILKDRLKRLPASVRNALHSAKEKATLQLVQESLRESEKQFRNLYNDAPAGLYRTTPDGKIILANKALINLLGFSTFEELSERNLAESGFDPSCLREEYIEQIEKNEEVKGLESKWICKDGRTIFVRENAKVIRDSKGKTIYFDGVVEDITEQKKAEKDLQESEERYRTLARISPVGIFRTDLNGSTTYVNPKWCEISGLSFKEGLGNGWLKAVHPDDREKLSADWENDKNVHRPSFSEYRFLRPDGTIAWVMGQAVPEMNSENQMIGYVGTITDITERVKAEIAKAKAEDKLRRNEERLNFAMEATSDGLFDNNIITGEIYWSPRYFSILGFEPNEFQPTADTYRKYIHPDDWDEIINTFNLKGKNEKNRFELIYRMRSKNDGWKWISSRFKVVKETEDGHPVRTIGTITDITNTKLYEIDLKRKNRALKVLSGCNEIIIKAKEEKLLTQNICDKIIDIAEFALVWVGYANNDVNKSVTVVSSAGDEEGYLDSVNIVWSDTENGKGPTGTAIRTGKPRIIHDVKSDQNFIPWLGHALKKGYQSGIALPLIEQNNVFGALSMYSKELNAFDKNELELLSELANDLAYGIIAIRTKEKHDTLQEQLLQSQKMEAIGKLAGGIAHDFNNMLTVILGNSELLSSELGDNDGAQKIMQRIILSTKKAAALTHQLLAFSRKQMVQPKIVDLNILVTDAQKMFYRLIGEDIDLTLNRATSLMKINADPGQIDQIIMNLVVNAKDAMPNGGNLTIKTSNIFLTQADKIHHPDGVIGQYVCLEVSDSGTGISEGVKSKIFDPFFTTKEHGKGTGLGLSVVYGIVKQNNGWIELETEIGIGTCFKIFFPGLDIVMEDDEDNGLSINKYSGKGEKIFIVEDDPDIRNMVHDTLTNYGYSIIKAKSIKQALESFKENNGNFDLVFMDIVLPDGSGIELYEQLHLINPDLKVLFTSGYADEKARWSIIQEKNYDFIQKPYVAKDLLKAIRKKISEKSEDIK